jgi:hypothetical protein
VASFGRIRHLAGKEDETRWPVTDHVQERTIGSHGELGLRGSGLGESEGGGRSGHRAPFVHRDVGAMHRGIQEDPGAYRGYLPGAAPMSVSQGIRSRSVVVSHLGMRSSYGPVVNEASMVSSRS